MVSGYLATFDPGAVVVSADAADEVAVRKLIRRQARDRDDELLLLDVLGVDLERPAVRRSKRNEHGTYAGWSRHNQVGTRPCRACLDAKAAYQKDYRERRRS